MSFKSEEHFALSQTPPTWPWPPDLPDWKGTEAQCTRDNPWLLADHNAPLQGAINRAVWRKTKLGAGFSDSTNQSQATARCKPTEPELLSFPPPPPPSTLKPTHLAYWGFRGSEHERQEDVNGKNRKTTRQCFPLTRQAYYTDIHLCVLMSRAHGRRSPSPPPPISLAFLWKWTSVHFICPL